MLNRSNDTGPSGTHANCVCRTISAPWGQSPWHIMGKTALININNRIHPYLRLRIPILRINPHSLFVNSLLLTFFIFRTSLFAGPNLISLGLTPKIEIWE